MSRRLATTIPRRIAALALFGSMPFAILGCAAVGPALAALGVAFGQDLMASAAVNYTPRYAMQTEALLNSIATQLTGVQMQPQLAQVGYRPPPPKYMRKQQQGQYGSDPYGSPSGNNQYGNPYGSNPYGNDPYASNDPYSQGAYSQDPYAQQAPYSQNDPYAQNNDPNTQNDPYAQQSNPYPQNDPYAQQSDPYAQQNDPYAQQNEPYAQQNDPYAQTDPYSQQNDPYGQGNPSTQNQPYAPNPYASRSNDPNEPGADADPSRAPISLDAALFVQRAGTSVLAQIKDGDILNDGRGNPAAGDVIKVHFAVDCACYVYVVGVDATGYVAQIYPDPDAQHTNPVQPGTQYRLPEGNEWWGLDDFRGIEQVYFLATRTRKPEIESALAQMAGQLRRSEVRGYQSVKEPAIVRTERGMVKVTLADPVSIAASGGATQQVAPTNYLLDAAADGLVITRWFEHR